MRRILFTLLVFTLFSFRGLSQNVTIQGNIYIKLIDVHNIVDLLPSTVIDKINETIANPNYDKEISKSERDAYDYYKFLLENKWMGKPHFKLKLETGKIINVFTNEVEYLKLKNKLEHFDRYEEQINVKFEGVKKADDFFKELDEDIYYAEKITSVDKILGVTDWKK